MDILELHRRFRRYCAIEEGLSNNTLRDLASTIKTFVKRSGAIEMSEIDIGLLRRFFYEGKERYQWSYYRFVNFHKYLKKFFNWCVLNKHMKNNPIVAINKPKRPQSLPRGLTAEEAQKVLYMTFSHSWRYGYECSRNHAIVATLLYAGLRRNELLSLELTDVNLDTDSILIRHGKGNKDRWVPVHYKLKYILKRYLADRKAAGKQSIYLFIGSRGNQQLGESGIKGIFKKLREITGIYFTPHQLRHTFGTIAVEQNIALPKIQQIMGHADIRSTMIYVKMSPKALAEGLNAIAMF